MPPDAPHPPSRAMVGRLEAARILGIGARTLGTWEIEGRVPFAIWGPPTSGQAPKLYPVQALLRLRDEYRKTFDPPSPFPDPNRPRCWRVPLRAKCGRGGGWESVRPMHAIVDADCLPLVRGRIWLWAEPDKYHTGCVVLSNSRGRNGPLRRLTPMRRIILGLEEGGPEHRIVHANGDPLDCRRGNLIVQTHAEQLYRTRKKGAVSGREYTSKYKGVSWNEERGKWKAQIQKDGRNRCVGRFDDEVDAAEAYDRAAQELFGEFALLNFPDGVSDAASTIWSAAA